MKYQHTLNPTDFDGKTFFVLQMMLQDEYPESNIGDVNSALDGLYRRVYDFAAKSDKKFKDPYCQEILKTIHIMARLWADLWLARGEAIFNEKLIFYHHKAQKANSVAHDQLLLDSLLAIAPDPDVIQRATAKLQVTSRLRSRR